MTRKPAQKKSPKKRKPPLRKGRRRGEEDDVKIAPINPPGGGVPRGGGPGLK